MRSPVGRATATGQRHDAHYEAALFLRTYLLLAVGSFFLNVIYIFKVNRARALRFLKAAPFVTLKGYLVCKTPNLMVCKTPSQFTGFGG